MHLVTTKSLNFLFTSTSSGFAGPASRGLPALDSPPVKQIASGFEANTEREPLKEGAGKLS
jgi:hypothetical protein